LTEDVHKISRLNNGNMSAGKPGLLSVHGEESLLMLVKCSNHNSRKAVAFLLLLISLRLVRSNLLERK
jgi:hypothetical protein